MLVLTRRAGEAIMIGRDIEVSVVAIADTSVRVGVAAPSTIRVRRTEIAERPARAEDTNGSRPIAASR